MAAKKKAAKKTAKRNTRKKVGSRSPARRASKEMPGITGKRGGSPLSTLLHSIVERRDWLRGAAGPTDRQEILMALSSVLEVAGYLQEDLKNKKNRVAVQKAALMISNPFTLSRANAFSEFMAALDDIDPDRER